MSTERKQNNLVFLLLGLGSEIGVQDRVVVLLLLPGKKFGVGMLRAGLIRRPTAVPALLTLLVCVHAGEYTAVPALLALLVCVHGGKWHNLNNQTQRWGFNC